ncbi:XRE family transcriptional regulator [Brevibacillus laterosporus]|uniref:Transcriptional regulator, y4mF family n=1 Tax=Brevibacillus laterosporus LMG 15441 TaxID=1042163 RepID=A0A075R207_BRELA|nr:helix-turn-helix transcriptional regulator [Brevibacillus laterosporus]AIG25889.1 transcriptional regulator, y4mF family [Brevibacillus laterosporus LMG 15441]RJL12917.1 XRE family transcriptional regulator [Brevibacillus laterosporus]TPH08171.1 XRE family transcriptional regulator [Brevibacillus laterosporus]
MERNKTLVYTTLGDLIKEKREEFGLTISELARLTSINKGVISKLESGETKRPELKTIRSITEVLKLPYTDIVQEYAKIEKRVEVLFDLMIESIEISQFQLIPHVAQKILESPSEETYKALERLYNLTSTIKNNDEVKRLLYCVIIKYARQHGVPMYIARGLFQQYIIEREDLKRLEKTFQTGEEILHYVDFLSDEEQIIFYYRMALHAHNIKKYEKCIELGQTGMKMDLTINTLKESVALAMCNSYAILEDYESFNAHLDVCEKKGYRFIIECIKYYRAIILYKTGQHHEAIPLLTECVEEVEGNRRLHRLNMLLEALFEIKNSQLIGELIKSQEKHFPLHVVTPYQHAQLGKYYRFKGTYLIENGQFDVGIESYLKSISFYARIGSYQDIIECSKDIFYYHAFFQKKTEIEIAERLNELYSTVTLKERRGVL